MKNKKVIFILFALALVGLSWGFYEFRYQYSYYRDLSEKPWAYSRDANAKLLVGQWQGNFTDPNGIAKRIDLEIYVPTTEEERKASASKTIKHKRSVGALKRDNRHFDGGVKVESTLGTEKYTFYGYVGEEAFHTFKMTFGHEDETKKLLSNFALNLGENGNWQEDELTMELHFSYINEQGSSYWESDNPKHQQTAVVKFRRK